MRIGPIILGRGWIPCSEPACQSRLNRFAFAAVLIVNNHFGAGRARTFGSVVGRSIVDHKYVVESFASTANDVANMLFIFIRRNNCGGMRTDLAEPVVS